MDVRQLTYFLRVAERKSITLAASELSVAQPTLTKSMKLLEEELGTALFQRMPRGVELTDAGLHLVRHAEAIIIQMREARAELNALQQGHHGMVTIGAGPAWLAHHLPEAVSMVVATRPDMRVRVVGGFDEALLRGLRRGDLDFVVAEVPWSQSSDDLEVEVLTSADLIVCARAGHPLSTRTDVEIAELLNFPWVLPIRATRARQRLDALFMSLNTSPPEPAVETESMAFMLAMVRNSNALTYTTATTLQMPEGKEIVGMFAPALNSERSAGIIRRRASWLSPAALTIIIALRAICQAQPLN